MPAPASSPVPLPERLTALGGVATRPQLRRIGTREEVERALGAGEIVRLARGRYALPTALEARRAAHRLTGVFVELSAAAHWGWGTSGSPTDRRWPCRGAAGSPSRPVPWSRSAGAATRPPISSTGGSPRRCARSSTARGRSPFAEALAVADSVLRSGRVRHADSRAANRQSGA